MDATHSNKSQAAAILRHLQAGHSLTPLEALSLFHCFRLGARIWELCRAGHAITKELVRVKDAATGRPVRVARYKLAAA